MKLARRMSRLGTETAFEALARARALEAEGRSIIYLGIGEPDYDTPEHIRDAAKAALESHIRQLAFELAPQGIAANAIRAGVTNTPALQRIPEGPGLLAPAEARNPSRRATTPADIPPAIAALAHERLAWMTDTITNNPVRAHGFHHVGGYAEAIADEETADDSS